MGLVSLPNTLTDGSVARGSEVRANDDAIVAEVNGNLSDVNIAVGAAINGSKLSNVAGSRVPTDRIEDDAVDATKLRDDPAAGAPTAAVTSAHIRDNAVLAGKVKLTTVNWTPAALCTALGGLSFDTGILVSDATPIGVSVVRAGVPTSTFVALVIQLWENTVNNHYYITVGCAVDTTTVGLTFRARFFAKA